MATRWRPDTCKCVLVYEGFDGDRPTGAVVEVDCGGHGKHKDPADHIEAVIKANRKAAKRK